MCLIFVAYNRSTRYRFVIASNRDEFRERQTAQLDYIGVEKNILGGRDLQAGGMWLGVCRGGKFGAITNYRDGSRREVVRPSRGEIVAQYLYGNETAIQAVTRLAEDSDTYAGFNVLFGDDKHLIYFSNKQNEIQILKSGFYGLSNHFLNTPWPKVTKGKKMLYRHMCDCEKIDVVKITSLLHDMEVPDSTLLPDTGVGVEWERFLSPVFIDGKEYGTRSTAVVEIGSQGNVLFTETSYFYRAEEKEIALQKQMSFDVGP